MLTNWNDVYCNNYVLPLKLLTKYFGSYGTLKKKNWEKFTAVILLWKFRNFGIEDFFKIVKLFHTMHPFKMILRLLKYHISLPINKIPKFRLNFWIAHSFLKFVLMCSTSLILHSPLILTQVTRFRYTKFRHESQIKQRLYAWKRSVSQLPHTHTRVLCRKAIIKLKTLELA